MIRRVKLRSVGGAALMIVLLLAVAACAAAPGQPDAGTDGQVSDGDGGVSGRPEPTGTAANGGNAGEGDGTEGPSLDTGLESSTWRLVAYGPEDDPIEALPQVEATARFSAGDVGGNASCNSYGGRYEVNGEEIMISELFQTEMACLDDGVMEQESAFMEALRMAHSFRVEGDELMLFYDGGVLRFTRLLPAADQSLEGTPWQLSSFGRGDVVHSLVSASEITAEFAGGTVTGTGGCNQYQATYSLEGESLTVGPVGATKIACEEGLLAQEQEFFDALSSATGFTLEGDQLILVHDNGSLFFTTATR